MKAKLYKDVSLASDTRLKGSYTGLQLGRGKTRSIRGLTLKRYMTSSGVSAYAKTIPRVTRVKMYLLRNSSALTSVQIWSQPCRAVRPFFTRKSRKIHVV